MIPSNLTCPVPDSGFQPPRRHPAAPLPTGSFCEQSIFPCTIDGLNLHLSAHPSGITQVSRRISTVSPPSSAPRCRWGIPLSTSIIMPAVLVAIAFMVVLWQTTSATASKSVESLSG
eukprot:RCo031034